MSLAATVADFVGVAATPVVPLATVSEAAAAAVSAAVDATVLADSLHAAAAAVAGVETRPHYDVGLQQDYPSTPSLAVLDALTQPQTHGHFVGGAVAVP